MDADSIHSSAEAYQAFALSTVNWCKATRQPLPYLPILQAAVDNMKESGSTRIPSSLIQAAQQPGA